MRRRYSHPRLLVVLVTLSSVFVATELFANDWPQWRGPGSAGVGALAPAPERWSSTEGVSWRAAIEGAGASSPVIAKNRVYVTTALAERRRSPSRLACDFLTAWLAGIGVPTLMRRRWTMPTTSPYSGSASLLYRVVRTLDWTLFVVLAIAVLAFASLMAIGPAAVDIGVRSIREVAISMARWLGREQTNFSFLTWDQGAPHNIWIMSSAAALAALALLPFNVPRRRFRIAGALTLLLGVVLAKMYVPWPSAYSGQYPTGALIVLYSPVAALAVWHVVASLVLNPPAPSGRVAHDMGLTSGAPVLLALTLFLSPNFATEQELVTRRLVCLDAATGERVWHTDVFASPPEAKASQNSYATPTPIVMEHGIVVSFGFGIAAVGHDGELRWSRTFQHWIEGSVYGAASSPVSDGRAVYVTTDREFDSSHPSRVVAYSAVTGDELWSQAPSFAHDGYATPLVHDDGARQLLLTLTSKALVAYDRANGTLAWKVPTPVGQPVPSLVAEGDRLYVTGPGGYTAAYEFRSGAAPDEVWQSRRNPADVSSPVLYGGRLYTISTGGIIVSYDARSGRTIWRQRLDAGLGGFYASLAAADHKIYAVRSDGTTFVLAAEDTFRLVSESSVSEQIFASPAFGADCLFLRTASALYCIAAEKRVRAIPRSLG